MTTSVKSIYLPLILVLIVNIFVACSSSDKNRKNEDEQKASYHYQAMDLKLAGGSPQECIELQKKAVEQLRRGEAPESGTAILSQMGYFYSRNGEFLNGLMFLQEATDSMRKTPDEELDKDGAITLLGNTANLYVRMGLYDEALSLNTKAIDVATEIHSTRISDLLRMRALVFEQQEELDSTLKYINKAIMVTSRRKDSVPPTARIRPENQKAYLFIEHEDYMPDSIPMAITILEKNMPLSNYTWTDSLLIGRGYVLTGNPRKGLEMMRAALPNERTQGDENLEFSLRFFTKSLIETQLSPEDRKLYEESQRLTKIYRKNLRDNALLGADFHYRTSLINNEKKLLEMRVARARERLIYSSILIVIIIASIASYFIRRYRRQRQLLEEKQVALQQLIDDRITLNKHIEELNSIVQQNIVPESEQPQQEEEHILTMTLLTKNDEQHFRQLFNVIHPGFIEKIRTNFPEISSGNEIICMMIRLHKSNEEISLALGIKRESVAKARYRLRTLFNLPKEVELNDFIASL